MSWGKLLSPLRRKDKHEKRKALKDVRENNNTPRTEHERDYDRILFSTPFRRLADKTQVFPLEANDSVRTRLTHSLEVSNLCRSIGVTLAFIKKFPADSDLYKRNIPAILAAIGLAHDLGNPPFGHQGESAIRKWVEKKNANDPSFLKDLNEQQQQDFLKFEGNAQTLRLLTRLQIINDNYGLNPTYGTLAALMKYTVPSHETSKDNVASKKHGYFFSENEIVQDIFEETGLEKGKRHPLAFIMEACDDMAYAVLDAEDTVKKGIASFYDLEGHLETRVAEGGTQVIEKTKKDMHKFREEEPHLTPRELNDITMQMFRVYALGFMVPSVVDAFMENKEDIMEREFTKPLIEVSKCHHFCEGLKEFDKAHAYRNRRVLEVELTGFNVISDLLDWLWEGITDRRALEQLNSERNFPFSAYAYSRISENYRRIAEDIDTQNQLPMRYIELQLLTDMLSGMTDSFALSLHKELRELRGEGSCKK